jgi:hypothetical protein
VDSSLKFFQQIIEVRLGIPIIFLATNFGQFVEFFVEFWAILASCGHFNINKSLKLDAWESLYIQNFDEIIQLCPPWKMMSEIK